ncbi:uncharacterized protein DS421_15g493220 [Arachis hypogaea]|nr:uncharacterized protein DS421_15g493220 [Arachis hypogaea]
MRPSYLSQRESRRDQGRFGARSGKISGGIGKLRRNEKKMRLSYLSQQKSRRDQERFKARPGKILEFENRRVDIPSFEVGSRKIWGGIRKDFGVRKSLC